MVVVLSKLVVFFKMEEGELSGLAQYMGELRVEEDQLPKVLDSLTLEGIVNLLKELQSSEDSKLVHSIIVR